MAVEGEDERELLDRGDVHERVRGEVGAKND